jgi:hypothetical protein
MRKIMLVLLFVVMSQMLSCVVVDVTEPVDLLVFSGQSNMQGKTRDGYPESGLQVGNSRTYEYKHLTQSYAPCVHPVGETIPGTGLEWAEDGTSASLAPFFATHWLALGRTPLVVHVAGGGQSVMTFIEGGTNRDAVNEKIDGAIANVGQIDKRIGKRLFFWLQGESDANMTVDQYKTAFLDMWNEKKTLFGLETAYIIRIRAHSEPSYYSVLAAQEELAIEHDDIVMLTRMTQDFSVRNGMLVPNDPIHYSTLAYMHMASVTAQRAFDHSVEGRSFQVEQEAYEGVTALIRVDIPLVAINLKEDNVTLPVNRSIRLTVEFNPGNATDRALIWSSSDPGIVTVDSEGVVTPAEGASPGMATTVSVTACSDRSLTDSVLITLANPEDPLVTYHDVMTYLSVSPQDPGYDVEWLLTSGADHRTNLYDLALDAGKVAFCTYIPSSLVRTTWESSPGESIIIPVSPGMRIAANSFGSAGSNGGTSDGIRVSFMGEADAEGAHVISQLSPPQTYESFSGSPVDPLTGLHYLTVPETCGTNEIRTRYMEVVFWTRDQQQGRWVYNLDLYGWRYDPVPA